MLKIQHKFHTTIDLSQDLLGQLSRALGEIGTVQGHDLGNVDDGISREPGRSPGNEHVAGGVREAKIRRQCEGDDRSDPAPIERVRLDHEDGTAIPGADPCGSSSSTHQTSPRWITSRTDESFGVPSIV